MRGGASVCSCSCRGEEPVADLVCRRRGCASVREEVNRNGRGGRGGDLRVRENSTPPCDVP